MSSTYSAALEASRSDLSEQACEQLHSARTVLGHEQCSHSTGQASLSTPMSESLRAPTLDLLTLSAADSPVRMSQSPIPMRLDSMANGVVFGSNTPELLARYDRASSSWRTSQSCLLEGWEEFSERWPNSGTMRNGEFFEVLISDYPASVSGSGLLPSPNARDGKDVSSTSVHLASRQRHQPSAATRLLERGLDWKLISTAYELTMGFPLRWSAAVYTAAVTRSSRKSRKRSEGAS